MTAAAVPRPHRGDGGARGPRAVPDGLLAVDKPAGPTSHDVVAEVRRRLGAPGAGHLGTLDPAATGLLLIATGAATRCIAAWQGGDKTYEARVRFGIVTSTQDLDGDVLERREPGVDEAAIRAASVRFIGRIEQRPPMVSALKHRGERLHAIARRGETIERAPRTIHVASWEWLEFAPPEARFRVRCSAGTYVRTLAHDLGEALGCGAALAGLRRLRSEPFGLERAIGLDALRALPADAIWARAGIPLDAALAHLPALTLDAAAAREIGFGRRPTLELGRVPPEALGSADRGVVLREADGRALGLGSVAPSGADPSRAEIRPRVVFPWAVREGAA